MTSTSRLAVGLLVLSALGASLASGQSLDGRPFRTFEPAPLASGQQVLELGADWRSRIVPLPILSPDKGTLFQAPVIRYRIGFGRAELTLGGAVRQRFDRDAPGALTSEEYGDLAFWVKVAAVKQGHRRPALSFDLGAKLPNANNESGLGTDEADTFGGVILGHAGPAHDLRLNLGLAILGDPVNRASQEDMLTYGVAGRHGARHALLWEIWGRGASSDKRRDIEESTLRLGYGHFGRRASFDVSILEGLRHSSGDLGASAGVTWLLGRRQ